ncbi:MAG: DUF2779 domain-containing protein [Desulfofustis sp.]|nr:DUF2779 domain-containing protein [Desulfofustis sp.]
MSITRYLTKSRFKLALECPAKLFYTGKTEYANQKLEDSFLLALAEGGFQVGELAKCYFPGGHEVKTLDHDQAVNQTKELLQADKVTIYEAALAAGNLFVRADILVKNGNRLSLYEVKAKSFNSEGKTSFLTKKGAISSEWRPFLYDVAFQKHVIKQAVPSCEISASLMLVDKTALCPTDGLNQKFQVVRDRNGRSAVVVSDSLAAADLTPPILCTVNADTICDQIYAGSDGSKDRDCSFEQWVDFLASKYASDSKIQGAVSSTCSSCEFYTTEADEMSGLKSGRKECWQELLGWEDEDFACQTVLDIWSFRKKDTLIEVNRIKLSELTEEDIAPKPDKKPGLSASERQWLQVEKYQTGDNTAWLDRDGLSREMDRWRFPLHFIDFETTMVAIPFNAGRHPYEGVAFQFSHHVVDKDGKIEHRGEYLNTARGVFPNYDFARQLKAQLENDSGTIFRYASHENSFLLMILRQLQSDRAAIEDRDELCSFIMSITQSSKNAEEQWAGERNMVDMLELVKRYYYDPATKGSNSIKQVLPALLNSSRYLQETYARPIYGAPGGIKSLNFRDWQWIRRDGPQD